MAHGAEMGRGKGLVGLLCENDAKICVTTTTTPVAEQACSVAAGRVMLCTPVPRSAPAEGSGSGVLRDKGWTCAP